MLFRFSNLFFTKETAFRGIICNYTLKCYGKFRSIFEGLLRRASTVQPFVPSTESRVRLLHLQVTFWIFAVLRWYDCACLLIVFKLSMASIDFKWYWWLQGLFIADTKRTSIRRSLTKALLCNMCTYTRSKRKRRKTFFVLAFLLNQFIIMQISVSIIRVYNWLSLQGVPYSQAVSTSSYLCS